MMKKSVCMKSKIFPRLNSLLNRGKLASTALGKVLQYRYELYYSTLTCRSEEHLSSIVSPRDHEFSCSNSPAYSFSYHISKLRNRGSKHGSTSAGFGYSPETRQLRVTDSPFSVKDMGEDYQVDIHAEEFIKRFYKDLEKQRWLTG